MLKPSKTKTLREQERALLVIEIRNSIEELLKKTQEEVNNRGKENRKSS